MPVWKTLVVGALACICLALGFSTIVMTASQEWLWMGGLLSATIVMGILFGYFLRYAGHSLDLTKRGARR